MQVKSVRSTKLLVVAAVVVIAFGTFMYLARTGSIYVPYISPPYAKILFLTAKSTPSEIVGEVLKKYNIDKQHHLDVTIEAVAPGDLERRYFDGEVPIISMGVASAAEGYTKGVPTTIIGPALLMNYDIVVPENSSIQNLSDLKGKILGVLPQATAAYSTLITVLKSAGINPQTDLTLSYGATPDINKRLLDGEIDAGTVSYPTGAALFATGKVRSIAHLETVWESSENGLPLPLAVIVVRNDWYAAHKQEAQEFVDAWTQAETLVIQHPEVIDGLTDYLNSYGLNSPNTLALLHENVPKTLLATWGKPEADAVTRFFDRSKQYGFIPQNVAPPTVVY